MSFALRLSFHWRYHYYFLPEFAFSLALYDSYYCFSAAVDFSSTMTLATSVAGKIEKIDVMVPARGTVASSVFEAS